MATTTAARQPRIKLGRADHRTARLVNAITRDRVRDDNRARNRARAEANAAARHAAELEQAATRDRDLAAALATATTADDGHAAAIAAETTRSAAATPSDTEPATPARRRRARGGRNSARSRAKRHAARDDATPAAVEPATAPAVAIPLPLLAWLLQQATTPTSDAAKDTPAATGPSLRRPRTPARAHPQPDASPKRATPPRAHRGGLPLSDLTAAAEAVTAAHGRPQTLADSAACLNPTERRELTALTTAGAFDTARRRLQQMATWRLAAAHRPHSPRASERLGGAIAAKCLELAPDVDLHHALTAAAAAAH